ncbi:MAG: carboxylating nicotinate-nucleotide diphosphorylase [Candidatus Poseidoniia archaeon]|nr:carboxylating nicotinate-nucleotide diphosphorylase [Candidatus Poseidoniia archaeon]MDP7006700.1 carboxylating nicotinate-nucleotide diphosphorylase [Candidatus Poseidoniia archaeon]|tara:strand:+ start:79 stop:891 length:813 start_codon:yes stop_codon:yes gene_type:complete
MELAAALEQWLAEDLGAGDVTSQAVVDEHDCTAAIRGGPGTLSGAAAAELLFAQGGVRCDMAFSDGDTLPADVEVARLAGPAREILARERLALNLLAHLSGIATLTAAVIARAKAANPAVEVLATRKTIPGLRVLEKQAVVDGGGGTHRMRLDDALLVKDNHLRLCASITEAVRRAREAQPGLELVVEADTVAQALEAAEAGADRVLLDNFSVGEAAAAASQLRPFEVAIELSGGLTLENVADYAPHGDCLSLGVLTLGAPPVDFGLHVD